MPHPDTTSADQSGDPPRQRVFDSYGRLSRVPETGELEKIEDQLADNRAVIGRLGAILGEELSDGMSAWKRGVRRPGWERMLERVGRGESDGIVVWRTDRLFRQPRDLEALIDLADKGFTVASARGTRDLSNPDDRFILRIEVAHAARSSDDTQRRVKRRFERMRQNGLFHSPARALGFPGTDRTTPQGEPRREVAPELVEREREALRSATAAVLAETPFTTIATRWNKAGLRTIRGKLWEGTDVRHVLLRPRNAGLIEHDGIVVGRVAGDPIVPVDQFERLRAKLAARRPGRIASGTYVGSGILRCELCNRPLWGRPHCGTYPDGERRRQYACRKNRAGCGKVAVDVRAVDDELRGFVISRLSDRDHAAALTAARVGDRLAVIEKEIRDIETLQGELSERLGRRDKRMTLTNFDRANEPLEADLARLRAERESLSDGDATRPRVKTLTPEQVAAQWDDGDTHERGGMLINALAPGRIHIAPADRTRERGIFHTTRIKFPEPAAA